MVKHQGGCHCGRIRFQIEAPVEVTVDDCTCSICRMAGFEHLIVDAEHFTLLQGDEWLTTYQFGTNTAQHLFCRHCGVKSFYVPRSHPEGFSVNFRCLDQRGFEKVHRATFDGENWEQNIDGLRERTP